MTIRGIPEASSDIQKFRDADNAVRSLYDIIPLTSFEEAKIDGEDSASYFIKVVRNRQNIKPLPYSEFKIYDELRFIAGDVKYYTALLHFLRPYITDSTNDGTYHQTLEDRRYMMAASTCFQSVYNFWDRIGDILNAYFVTGLPDSSNYFSRVLNNFPAAFRNSENYIWLNDNFNSEIKRFVGQRDNIVHTYQLECEFYWRVMEAKMDMDKIEMIQAEKESFPEVFVNHLKIMHEGFPRAIKLIQELPEKAFTNLDNNSPS
jgi:hypothetical protein